MKWPEGKPEEQSEQIVIVGARGVKTSSERRVDVAWGIADCEQSGRARRIGARQVERLRVRNTHTGKLQIARAGSVHMPADSAYGDI